jgi:hypothetical protein
MPGVNGLDLCRAMRIERPETKLCLMSGNHNWQQESSLLGVPFLAKPFTANAIRGCIDSSPCAV